MLDNLTTIYAPTYSISFENVVKHYGILIFRKNFDVFTYLDPIYCMRLISAGCKLIKLTGYDETGYVITDFGNNTIFQLSKILKLPLIINNNTIIIDDTRIQKELIMKYDWRDDLVD